MCSFLFNVFLNRSLVKTHKSKLSALSNQLTAYYPMANTVLIVYIAINYNNIKSIDFRNFI